MKKVFVREDSNGRYSLQNFGIDFTGVDGTQSFLLVVESRALRMEFPKTRLFDLFTTFDLHNPDFLQNRYLHTNFLRVTIESEECVVEAGTGTLYDFFKERVASGDCTVQSSKQVAFYWTGNSDQAA